MDLTIIDTIIGAIFGSLGWIAKQLADRWKESRGRRKSEMQKLTNERDKFRTLKFRWKKACYATQYLALRKGVPHEDLPRTPDDDRI